MLCHYGCCCRNRNGPFALYHCNSNDNGCPWLLYQSRSYSASTDTQQWPVLHGVQLGRTKRRQTVFILAAPPTIGFSSTGTTTKQVSWKKNKKKKIESELAFNLSFSRKSIFCYFHVSKKYEIALNCYHLLWLLMNIYGSPKYDCKNNNTTK